MMTNQLFDKKIVAIDDTKSILTFLRISMESHGATFHAATTAAEGVELCLEEAPDLVVLDLGLPDKDGLDILPELKSFAKKVIVLTARREETMKDAAKQLGADAYLTKPFMMDDLLDVIDDVLPQ